MAAYEVELSRSAERTLRRLERADQDCIVASIRALGVVPFPRGSRKLQGYDDVFRLRVGRFRILYSVDGMRLVIVVLRIGDRRDVYRRSGLV